MNDFVSVPLAEMRQDQETISLGRVLSIADQIQAFCLARKTAEIRVTNVVPSGRINILDGEVVHAEFGNRIGMEAAIGLINLQDPQSEIQVEQGSRRRTIHLSYSHLLLEAAKCKDESAGFQYPTDSTRTVMKVPTIGVMLGADSADYPLRTGVTFIGRNSENDIVIPAMSISRHHASITLSDDSVIVRDLGSTNGTFVDGEQVAERSLVGHLRLRFGSVDALFTPPA